MNRFSTRYPIQVNFLINGIKKTQALNMLQSVRSAVLQMAPRKEYPMPRKHIRSPRLRGTMSAEQFVHALVLKYEPEGSTQMGTMFARLVRDLSREVENRATYTIVKLNGSGSPVYDPKSPLFDASVKMVAEDIANAILHRKIDLAVHTLQEADKDVLAEQAHLSLDN